MKLEELRKWTPEERFYRKYAHDFLSRNSHGKSRDVPCNHFRETNLPPHRSRRLRSSSFSRSTSKRLVGLSITIISGFSIITRAISLR